MNDGPPPRRAGPQPRHGPAPAGAVAQPISVFGAGYVGLVTAACLAALGHRVWCVDSDPARIHALRKARIPFHEADLPRLVAAQLQAGRLRFGTEAAPAIAHGRLHFIAVGTPPQPDGSADLQHVLAVARALVRHLQQPAVVVLKSTVPVGTGDRVRALLHRGLRARGLGGSAHAPALPVAVCANPEFLREGQAVRDFMQPDRVVIGGDDPAALQLLQQLYAPLVDGRRPLLVMDRRSAEFTKYAANAMLAARLSTVNELALLAEALGADFETARAGLGSDARLGPAFLAAGCGFGGSCLPKDVAALLHAGLRLGLPLPLLHAVDEVNRRQKLLLVDRLSRHFGGRLEGRRIALWGLAFKPGTDDLREAPSVAIIERLLAAGCRVAAHDPLALPAARRLLGESPGLAWAPEPLAALHGADALLIATDWPAYAAMPPEALRAHLRTPLVFDGRNLFDPARMAAQGIAYHAIGRAPLAAASAAPAAIASPPVTVPLIAGGAADGAAASARARATAVPTASRPLPPSTPAS